MLVINDENKRFSFRVAGLAIHQNKVLLHRYETDEFWVLPGGRAELLESTEETILREIKEELDEDVSINRLLYVNETFFEHQERIVHELCFYYHIEFKEDSDILNNETTFERKELDGSVLTFKWFDLESVEALDVYPVFIKESIKNLPQHINHIVEDTIERQKYVR